MRKLLLAAAAASSLAARAHAAGRLVLVGGGGTPELARQRCVEGGSGRVLVVTAPTKDPRQSQRDWEAETGMSWSQWKADVADSFARAGASSV
ncbi:MAG TPA: hypothetical protein VNI01_16265, partial [Elusimicrobiota bacterium]|nr:hypothetical protein [Elusimicrobiota bacterium]